MDTSAPALNIINPTSSPSSLSILKSILVASYMRQDDTLHPATRGHTGGVTWYLSGGTKLPTHLAPAVTRAISCELWDGELS